MGTSTSGGVANVDGHTFLEGVNENVDLFNAGTGRRVRYRGGSYGSQIGGKK